MRAPWSRFYDRPVDDEPAPLPATIPELLAERARSTPGWIATTADGVDTSYAELDERATRLAHALGRLGLAPGDRVALILPNSTAYAIACYGALRAGLVVVNVNVLTRGPELARVLAHTGARAVVTLDVCLAPIEAAARDGGSGSPVEHVPVEHVIVHRVGPPAASPPAPEGPGPRRHLLMDLLRASPAAAIAPIAGAGDLALLQLTSGTTATPKVVMLTHGNVVANIGQMIRFRQSPPGDNGAVICVLPFFHVFGFTVCLHLSVVRGLRMVLVPRFDPTSILPLAELLERWRPVSFPAVPSLWAALLQRAEQLGPALRQLPVASSGGAPLSPALQQAFTTVAGRPLLENYGLSEASSTTHMMPALHPLRPGSIGVPIPDTEARIVDLESGERELPHGEVGELIVRGPQVMKGYWRDEALGARVLRGGWLHTGDLARRDDDGYFYLVDRKDDLVIVTGFNVYPSEVEAVLGKHPAVREALVVGVADAARGQHLAARVVLRPGLTARPDELQAHCAAELPPYKVPRTIRIVDDLPRSPTGKPLRRGLVD